MPSPTPKKVACATMLTGEGYLIGALVLGYTLRRHGWQHETLALVTPDISQRAREQMRRYWDRIIEVENIANPNPPETFGLSHYGTMYTKLRIWEHDEYDKIVYLDSDTIVMGSLDAMLERGDFAAAPDMAKSDVFNAGVMAIKPSKDIFADMMSKIESTPSHDGSDQGFLNNYFSDWYTGPAAQRLPLIYNVSQFAYIYAPAWRSLLPDMRVLHYTAPKPWKYRSRIGRAIGRRLVQSFTEAPRDCPSPFQLWWQAFDEFKNSQK